VPSAAALLPTSLATPATPFATAFKSSVVDGVLVAAGA
jgi:hypothetical protein